MKQNRFWFKLIGTAILLHVVLILFSIIEVVIYSYLIVPGKEKEVYNAHAAVSAPWISAIFGSLLMLFLVKRFLKRFSQQQLTFVIALPVIYHSIDLILFFVSGNQFKDFFYLFVLVNVPKIVAVILAYFLYRNKNRLKKRYI